MKQFIANNIIKYMFYKRQFESLQKILSYVNIYISPSVNYLLAWCYIKVDHKKQIKNIVLKLLKETNKWKWLEWDIDKLFI